jgi:hypothetical protein
MSTIELIEREIADLPEPQKREVYDFACFLRVRTRSQDDRFDGLIASESVLARGWDAPEEDEAWANL